MGKTRNMELRDPPTPLLVKVDFVGGFDAPTPPDAERWLCLFGGFPLLGLVHEGNQKASFGNRKNTKETYRFLIVFPDPCVFPQFRGAK